MIPTGRALKVGDDAATAMQQDIAQFAALTVFGGSRPRDSSPERSPVFAPAVRAAPDAPAEGAPAYGVLAVIDEVMRELGAAERELSLRLQADIMSTAEKPGVLTGGPGRLERLEQALAGETDAERRLMALLAYSRAVRGSGASEAASLAVRALQGDQLLSEGVGSPGLMAAGLALGFAGHTDEAEALFGGILRRAGLSQSRAAFCAASAQRGLERYHRGALAAALEDLRSALSSARGQPWETLVDDGRGYLLRVLGESGEFDAAERALDEWCATGPLPETTFGNRILIERGRLRLAQGRFEEALSDLSAAGARLERCGDSIMFEWRSAAAIANHRVGQQQRALTLARCDLEAAQAWGAPRQLAIAHRTLGEVQGGPAGIALFRDALTILDGTPAHLERARTLIALGAHLRLTGEPAQARAELRAGLDLATQCDAPLLVAKAEDEIAATGVRRRRRELASGPEALTPSEHRVARLAATGMSNPVIARTLFVTRKTVEMHLGNAYRKLEINSRGQLSGALGLGQRAV